MDTIDKYEPVSFEKAKREWFRDPEIKRMYNDMEAEFQVTVEMIRKRSEKGMTQKQLAEKMGTKQSAIARLEGGNANPSLAFLKKVAKALDSKLVISFQ